MRDKLSDRERVCLAWTSQGKSSWETGKILFISESTVKFHVKNAMRKLGTTTRTAAVVKAIELNLIDSTPDAKRTAEKSDLPQPSSPNKVIEASGRNRTNGFSALHRQCHTASRLTTPRRCPCEVACRIPALSIFAPERPAIAVLPFVTSGPELGLAAALSDRITRAIRRLRWIDVTAPQWARYHLSGMVTRDGNGGIRVTLMVVDISARRFISDDDWSGADSDLFAFERWVAAKISCAALWEAETNPVCRGRPPAELNSRELTMQALPHLLSISAVAEEEALELLERAMELAPDDPLPISLAAWCRGLRAGHHFTANRAEERRAARSLAIRAARLNRCNPLAATMLAAAYTLAHDLERAEAHIERALTLDSAFAWAWGRRGWIRAYRGEAAEAIQCFQIARALSPTDRLHFLCCHGIASALFDMGRYAASIGWFRRAITENPAAVWINRWLAAAYVLANRKEDGRRALAECMKINTGLTITDLRSSLPWHSAYLDRVAEGLETAGMRV